MKKILITLIISIFSINIVYANETKKVTLKKCVDGDTAIFIIDNEEIRVRFLAIDTPESVHPTKEVEAYGKNASEYTCNKLTNAKKITLEFDTGSTKTDKYGRTLAWVYVDGSMLQKELIEIGYAKVKYIYGKYKYIDELYEIEAIAKEKELGIWHEVIPNTYTVTFISDTKKTEVKVNENEKVEELIIEKDGYTFEGWYLNDKKYDFNKNITKDITLTAKYTKKLDIIDIIAILIGLAIIYVINPKKCKKIIKKALK